MPSALDQHDGRRLDRGPRNPSRLEGRLAIRQKPEMTANVSGQITHERQVQSWVQCGQDEMPCGIKLHKDAPRVVAEESRDVSTRTDRGLAQFPVFVQQPSQANEQRDRRQFKNK